MGGIGRNGKEMGGVKEIVKENLLKFGGKKHMRKKSSKDDISIA